MDSLRTDANAISSTSGYDDVFGHGEVPFNSVHVGLGCLRIGSDFMVGRAFHLVEEEYYFDRAFGRRFDRGSCLRGTLSKLASDPSELGAEVKMTTWLKKRLHLIRAGTLGSRHSSFYIAVPAWLSFSR